MTSAAPWIDLEFITLSEARQGKTNTICYHLNVESKRGHKRTHLGNKSRLVDTENRGAVDKGDNCQAPLAEIPNTHRITSTDTLQSGKHFISTTHQWFLLGKLRKKKPGLGGENGMIDGASRVVWPCSVSWEDASG